MTLGIPGINEKDVIDLYDGDFDIYLPVLRAYVDETPASLKKLRNVAVETLGYYAGVMHSIKGTSRSVCAEEAGKAAAQLEALAKAGNLSGVLSRNESFLEYMDNLVAGIQNWLSEKK